MTTRARSMSTAQRRARGRGHRRGSCISTDPVSTAPTAARTPRTARRGRSRSTAARSSGGGGGARGAAVRARRAHIADLRWRRAEPARTCGARCGGRRHGRALLQRRAAQPGAGGRPCLGAAGVGGVRGIRESCTWLGADGVSRCGSPASRPPLGAAIRTRSRARWHQSTRTRARSTAGSIPRARVRAKGSSCGACARSWAADPQESAKNCVWFCMQTIRRRLPVLLLALFTLALVPGQASAASRAPRKLRPRSTIRPRRAS